MVLGYTEYAVYKGDELVCVGTAKECAAFKGITTKSLWGMATPRYKKQLATYKKSRKATVVIRLEDDEEMDEQEKLTEQDYIFAEQNGIPRKTAKFRYEQQGWSVEKAISIPVRQTVEHGWNEYKEIAALCGVSYMTWWRRVSKGMDKEEAARRPTKQRQAKA